MWVGAEDGQTILMYTPAQYAGSGNPTPAVILNAASFKFDSPSHLSFDAAGNLWVVDEDRVNGQGGNGEVFRFDKAQITGLTAGNQNIDPVFGIARSEFVHLETIAFDGSGNLWLADQESDSGALSATAYAIRVSMVPTASQSITRATCSWPIPASTEVVLGVWLNFRLDRSGRVAVRSPNYS